MKPKSKLLFLIFFIFSINAFDTNQLPLSDKLKETFPKLNASCFIIANLDCSIVINESNSNRKIHTGTFDNIVFSTKLKKLKTPIEKQNNPFIGNNKLTLYDMINIFNCILINRSYISEIRQKNTKISIIKSAMSGYGCVFVYEHSGKYIGILYGANSREKVLNDIKNITNWLKQFYILDIKQNLIEIPVLYGNERRIDLAEQKRKILISKFTSGKIERAYHYKTVSCAPIEKGDIFGTVFYFSELFKNPIRIPLISMKCVKRSGILNRILDTIHYIIFGSNNSKHIDPSRNTSE